MKAVVDHINLLIGPKTLYFSYYENAPAPDSDVIIKHYHVLDKVSIGEQALLTHDFHNLMNKSHKRAIEYLSSYYYDNIDSPGKLQAIYNDLSMLFAGMSDVYRVISIKQWEFIFSTKFSIHIQTTTEKCKDTGDDFPFYEGFKTDDLTYDEHYQVIRTLSELAINERKHLDSIWSLLKKFDKEPPKEGFHCEIPTEILKDIYNKFAQYMQYGSEEEFLAAVNKMEKIKYFKGYYNHLAYLFHRVLEAKKIKPRSTILLELFGVKNKPRESLSDKPILHEIDAFLEGIDENHQA